MTFDPTKPVQTRDGRKARIICTDAKQNKYPIVALVTINDEIEDVRSYTESGYFYAFENNSAFDLINIPERKVKFANVYETHVSRWFDERSEADSTKSSGRIGVLKLIYEDNKLVDHEYEKLK